MNELGNMSIEHCRTFDSWLVLPAAHPKQRENRPSIGSNSAVYARECSTQSTRVWRNRRGTKRRKKKRDEEATHMCCAYRPAELAHIRMVWPNRQMNAMVLSSVGSHHWRRNELLKERTVGQRTNRQQFQFCFYLFLFAICAIIKLN